MLHSFQSVKVYKVMAYLPLQPSRDIQIISWSFQRTEMRNETVEILCDLIYLNSCFLTPSQLQAIFLPHHQVWSRFPIINRTQTPLGFVLSLSLTARFLRLQTFSFYVSPEWPPISDQPILHIRYLQRDRLSFRIYSHIVFQS